jgi:peptide/nickel transport system substrate-binding protein
VIRPAALILVTAASLTLAACTGSSAGSSNDFADGGTFVATINTDPGNLDPQRAADVVTNLFDYFAYDTLINLDAKGNPVSQLASKWTSTPTTATFTLRDDVTCSDGSKLTASLVKANFDFIKNPKSQSSMIGSQLPSAEYTTTADDATNTFTITMKTPYSFLLAGAGLVPIVCQKGMANRKLLAHGVDGTGPFRLTQSVAGDHYTFTARKDYKWGPDGATAQAPGFPDKVTFKVVQNSTTAVNLFLTGQLNAIDVSGVDHKRLTGRGYLEIKSPGGPIDFFFNERAGHPGADPQVRRALAMALDLPQLIKVVTEASGTAPANLEVNQPKPCRIPTVPGTLPAHDPAGAKALLEQAGWHAGSDGVRTKDGSRLAIKLLYVGGTPAEDAAMELTRDWWKDLGADVTLKGVSGNVVSQTLFTNGGGWDVSALGIGVSYPSQLVPFLSGPAAPDGQNFGAIQNPDYDRLVEQASSTVGSDACQVWADAEKELFKRVDLLPVSVTTAYSYGNKARYSFGVNGIEPTSIRLLAG